MIQESVARAKHGWRLQLSLRACLVVKVELMFQMLRYASSWVLTQYLIQQMAKGMLKIRCSIL
jgi:hypothetical protein